MDGTRIAGYEPAALPGLCGAGFYEGQKQFLAQYGWTFDLLAADGQSLLDAGSPWTRYNNASLYGQPEEWSTVSLPLRPDASLGGALSLEPYLAEDDIAIEAPRIPCWLAETAPVG